MNYIEEAIVWSGFNRLNSWRRFSMASALKRNRFRRSSSKLRRGALVKSVSNRCVWAFSSVLAFSGNRFWNCNCLIFWTTSSVILACDWSTIFSAFPPTSINAGTIRAIGSRSVLTNTSNVVVSMAGIAVLAASVVVRESSSSSRSVLSVKSMKKFVGVVLSSVVVVNSVVVDGGSVGWRTAFVVERRKIGVRRCVVRNLVVVLGVVGDVVVVVEVVLGVGVDVLRNDCRLSDILSSGSLSSTTSNVLSSISCAPSSRIPIKRFKS